MTKTDLQYAKKLAANNGRTSSDPRAYGLAVALMSAERENKKLRALVGDMAGDLDSECRLVDDARTHPTYRGYLRRIARARKLLNPQSPKGGV